MWVASTYGSDLRLYRSDDRGGSWQEEPLVDLDSYGLVSSFFLHGISPASGSVMPSLPTAVFSAGPHPNYELWFVQFDTAELEMATAVEEVESRDATGAPILVANAPNPFNNSTQMRFWLPAAGPVDLAVYNLQGQCVGQISKGHREAGWHAITWAAGDLATGVYLYRLQASGTEIARKLAVIR